MGAAVGCTCDVAVDSAAIIQRNFSPEMNHRVNELQYTIQPLRYIRSYGVLISNTRKAEILVIAIIAVVVIKSSLTIFIRDSYLLS